MSSPIAFIAYIIWFSGGWLIGAITCISWLLIPFRIVILIGGIWLVLNNYRALAQGVNSPAVWFMAGLLWGASSTHRKMEE